MVDHPGGTGERNGWTSDWSCTPDSLGNLYIRSRPLRKGISGVTEGNGSFIFGFRMLPDIPRVTRHFGGMETVVMTRGGPVGTKELQKVCTTRVRSDFGTRVDNGDGLYKKKVYRCVDSRKGGSSETILQRRVTSGETSETNVNVR